MAIRKQKGVAVRFLSTCVLLFCSTAGAQFPTPASPPVSAPAEVSDSLGRTTPRGTLLRFLIAAREGDNETAAQYLNTRQTGTAAAVLAHQLFIVLDRRLPAGLLKLSDSSEGSSVFSARQDRKVIGTIKSPGGNVDITIERVSRGKESQLWLFSTDTLSAVPRLYEERDATPLTNIIPKVLVTTHVGKVPLFQWLAFFVGLPLLYLVAASLNRLLNASIGLLRRHRRKDEARRNPNVLPVPVRLLFIALMIRWVLVETSLSLLGREFWTAAAGVVTIVACVWILILLNAVCAGVVHRRLTAFPISILRFGQRMIDGLLVFAGILIVFRYFGVNVTAAIAGLGVGGIAIALAAQKTLENVIGGISVLFDRAVRVGELIKIGDNCGFVEHVGMRSTRIRTFERTVVSIPNGYLANISLENISLRDKFWFHHTLNLSHETTVSTVREILEKVANLLAQCRHIEAESLRVSFLGFGKSSLDVETFAYVLAKDWNAFAAIQQGLLLDLMEIVEAAGTKLAYPSQSLHLASSNGTDGDAQQQAATDSNVRRPANEKHEAASGAGQGR